MNSELSFAKGDGFEVVKVLYYAWHVMAFTEAL